MMSKEIESCRNQANERDNQRLVLSYKAGADCPSIWQFCDERVNRPEINNQSERKCINIRVERAGSISNVLFDGVDEYQEDKNGN